MAQVFVSHSSKDTLLVDFLSRAFAGTQVKAIFEEFEKLFTGSVNSQKIIQHIENSNAVFVVLSPNVNALPHTRDWVIWETGVSKNKDIWVMEPYADLGKISVVTPHLRHYVLFESSDIWLRYVRTIIESYDDSFVLPAVLASGGAGALLSDKDRVTGAAVGAVLGLVGVQLLATARPRPSGIRTVCMLCRSSYSVHLPSLNRFRCPVCNNTLTLNPYG